MFAGGEDRRSCGGCRGRTLQRSSQGQPLHGRHIRLGHTINFTSQYLYINIVMTTFLRILSIQSFLVPFLLGRSLRSSFKSSGLSESGSYSVLSLPSYRSIRNYLHTSTENCVKKLKQHGIDFLFAEIKSSTCDKLDRSSN
jgi:hypothetical protein